MIGLHRKDIEYFPILLLDKGNVTCLPQEA